MGGVTNNGGPTLSVCCLTRGPTARVAAQLALLRDVADEIVVGLDTSVPAELAHPLEEVADAVVHYPYADPVDRPVGWAHSPHERRGARWWAKAVTPPILVIAAKGSLRRVGLLRAAPVPEPAPAPEPAAPPEFEAVPEGWARPVAGWDGGTVAEAYVAKWPEWVAALEGTGPVGVYHEAHAGEHLARDDMAAHNMLVSFAYVLARAAYGRDRVSVLDWGGGLGHYAVVARAVLPEAELDWHCREVGSVARAGATVNPEVTFHDDDTCLDRTYDLVLASSSLQYEPDWKALLRRLAGATAGLLLVTRLPVALESPSFVILQRADAYGYATEYLGWVVSREELLAEASAAGLVLDRELLVDAWLSAAGAPEDPIGHRGFLFRTA